MTRLFSSFSLTSLKAEGQIAANQSQRLHGLWQCETETRPSSSPGQSYHLLLFRAELWWFCFLVLASQCYPDLVGPSLPMAEWGWNQIFNTSSNPNHSTILPHLVKNPLRHSLYRNASLEMLLLQAIKAHWGFGHRIISGNTIIILINKGRLFFQQSERSHSEAEKMGCVHCCQSPKSNILHCP